MLGPRCSSTNKSLAGRACWVREQHMQWCEDMRDNNIFGESRRVGLTTVKKRYFFWSYFVEGGISRIQLAIT